MVGSAPRPSPPARRAADRAPPAPAPRTPAPGRRPARLTRILLGAVPGVRALAFDDPRRAAPYVALGLALATVFLLSAIGWSGSAQALGRLRIVERFELVDGVCLLLTLVAYEVLRLASALEERRRRPAAPRVVATPFLPSLLITATLPGLVHHAPHALEALWWGALVLAIGTSPAFGWCLVEDWLHTSGARRRFALAWGAAMGALLACVGFSSVLAPSWATETSAAARAAGFELLPRLLGG